MLLYVLYSEVFYFFYLKMLLAAWPGR